MDTPPDTLTPLPETPADGMSQGNLDTSSAPTPAEPDTSSQHESQSENQPPATTTTSITLPPLAPPPIFNKKGFPLIIPPGPSEPNQTLYVRNLLERVNIKEMKKTLRTLFEPYGDILDIIAAPTLKKRGQAFVVFEDILSAKKAIKELQYYPLYNKPMIIEYAKRKSDAIAALDGTLEEQKRRRLEERERRKQEKAHAVAQQPQLPFFPTPFPGMPGIPPMPLPNATEIPQLPLPNVPAPDLLVPNSILFIENLPSGATDIENLLVSLFNQYPGFKSVRLVPTKSDIAFVEFENEMFSAIARGALHGYKLLDVEIKVTFAKK